MTKVMKKLSALITVVVILVMVFCLAGCGGSGDAAPADENSLVGVWTYADEESGIGATYDLKDDGTGTYTMVVGEEEVTYELKYEVQEGHLLVTYVNNEIFTEDDVFDSEFSFKDENTIIIKDSTDMEMEFVRQ